MHLLRLPCLFLAEKFKMFPTPPKKIKKDSARQNSDISDSKLILSALLIILHSVCLHFVINEQCPDDYPTNQNVE